MSHDGRKEATATWTVEVDVRTVHDRAYLAVEAGKSTVKITPERLLALTNQLLALGFDRVGIELP